MDRVCKGIVEKSNFVTMRNKIIIIVIGCVLTCILYFSYRTSNLNMEGIYVSQNFTQNIDSIKIMSNGVYERIIYDNERELIFKNIGTYKKYDSHISFDEFLLNSNDLSIKNNYDSNDLLNASLSINTSLLGEVKLVVDHDLNYYYLKVK